MAKALPQPQRIFVVAHLERQRRGSGRVGTSRAYAERTPSAGFRRAVSPACVRTHLHCAHHQPHPRSRMFAAHTAGQRRHQGKPAPEGLTRAPHSALRGHRYAPRQRRHAAAYAHPPFAYAWADYGLAIRRWETVFGRAAPAPIEIGRRGQPRLRAELVEWMLLPQGWVTDPDLGMPGRAQLQALGNAVVPQQATAAVRHLQAEMAHAAGGGAA